MARVLIITGDSAFAAVVEDHLHLAGHEVELVDDGSRAVAVASDSPCDLALIEPDARDADAIRVIRALRAQPETRGLPILVLIDGDDAAGRVRALRAGADDCLTRPVDIDELILRAQRLLGVRSQQAPLLEGDLETHPLWEQLQSFEQAKKTGYLEVGSPTTSGRLRINDGRVIGARWRHLSTREAALAILGVKKGHFRFVADDAGSDVAAPQLKIHDLLFEAVWLEDQLARRESFLPPSAVPLKVTTKAPPTPGVGFRQLPVEPIARKIAESPGIRLFDLIEGGDTAPQKVRLTVAWLIEQGAVIAEQASEAPSTSKLALTALLELAIRDLLRAEVAGDGERKLVPILLLADPGAVAALRRILAAVPSVPGADSCRRLAERLAEAPGGSAVLPSGDARLTVHVERLELSRRARIEALLPVSRRLLIWLTGEQHVDLLRPLLERFEAGGKLSPGVLVDQSALAKDAVSGVFSERPKWQLTDHPPSSLLGILRLLSSGS